MPVGSFNEYLRVGLAQRRAVKAATPFRVEPVSMGTPLPGRSYDNIGALLEETEGPGATRAYPPAIAERLQPAMIITITLDAVNAATAFL